MLYDEAMDKTKSLEVGEEAVEEAVTIKVLLVG